MKKNYKARLGLFTMVFLFVLRVSAQQSYTFTPCGATGSIGPTQTQVNSAYGSTNLSGLVTTTTNGIQTWTVPYTGNFRIEAYGAQGGGSGGLGAAMAGDFALNGGEVIQILVGQIGDYGGSGPSGGSGGSFVVRTPYTTTTSILVIAGGGSGAGNYSFTNGTSASTGVSGGVAGGANGTGGLGGTRGAGGGGFLTNGSPCSVNTNYASPGLAFVNGGLGGAPTNNCSFTAGGGFGGGSSHGGNCINNGGAGGGFSGGGGSSNTTAGGGGSLNNGTNQINSSGTNTGDGRVIITELCSIQVYASATNSVNPIICSGNSVTLTTNAVSNYSWSTGQTTNSIVVAPTSNTVISLNATSSLNCIATGVMSITVSAGLPVISISNPDNNICLGKAVTLTASGAITYTWANAGVVNGQTFTPSSTTVYSVTGQNGCGVSTQTTGITVAPIQINVTASPTLVCGGFPSTLTAVSPATSYTWYPSNLSGSLTVVAPTSNSIYTVSVSDGTCSGTETVVVNTKITPSVSLSSTLETICQGEQVVIIANGADTYTWNPGNIISNSLTVSPSTSSLYTVIGENTVGCTASDQAIVIVQVAPQINVTASKTLVCTNQSVTLQASGGNAYVWTGGPSTAIYTVAPAVSTVYTVTGSHSTNTCTATKTINIVALVPNLTLPTNTAVCLGGSVTVYASGANSYVWNSMSSGTLGVYGIQPQNSLTVTLVATTQSLTTVCPVTHTFEINVNPLPSLTIAATNSIICVQESATLTASGAQSYTWNGTSNGTSIVATPSASGYYTITAVDANNCEATKLFFLKVNTCNGITEIEKDQALITIYPNPNHGTFMVKSDAAYEIVIINALGQKIKSFNLEQERNYLYEINDLKSGIYFIMDQNGKIEKAQKIIVE